MATVEKHVRGGKVTWQARWRDPTGKQRKESFAKRTEAVDRLTAVRHALRTGSYVDPVAGRVTVADWSAQWLAAQGHLKPSTRARYAGILARQVVPRWGTTPLAAVRHADVAAWVSDLPLAPATVRYVHRVFSLLLDLAVRDGRLAVNPATGVRLPRAQPAEKRFLDHDHVRQLADAAGEYRTLVLVLSYTGLRWGEAAALRVGRLDLMRRRLVVAESVTEVRGRLVWGTPKSHQQRSVPVPRFLVDDLAVQVAGKGPDALVFATPRGAVLRNLNWRRDVFDAAATSVGLDGLTPHELRHTAASLAVSAGANVKAVQRMLGHASAAMTLDVYSGLFDDDLDGVAERLDAASRVPGVPLVCPEGTVTPLTQRDTGS